MTSATAAATRPEDDEDAPAGDRPDLIAGLLAIARRDGLTGVTLCQRIGIDSALLSRATRTGLRKDRLGIVTCAKIVQVYPELSDAAAYYLAEGFGWPVIRALAALGTAAGPPYPRRRRRRATEGPPPDGP